MKRIVIDVFGADGGAEIIIRGVLKALEDHKNIGFTLVGDEKTIKSIIHAGYFENSRVSIIHTEDYIKPGENPGAIFGGRDTSSMALALENLKSDEDAVGMLSPGSTGALFVGSIFRLGLLGKLKRPALSSSLPRADGKMVCLLDCGANVTVTPKDLARFALMGDAYAKIIYKLGSPRVSLLSVGREDKKGTDLTLQAFDIIKELPINFIGNSEGNDLLTGYSDVVVADGFSGNVTLKCSEASGKIAMGVVKALSEKYGESSKEIFADILKNLADIFELNARGGATFLGTKKTLIKMHGAAVEETVSACVGQLLMLNENAFTEKTAKALENLS